MAEFIVSPNPQIHLSDADPYHLPLHCFHLIALVEPDPESWMVFPDDDQKFFTLLQTQYDLISEELFPEDEIGIFGKEEPPPEVAAQLVSHPHVLWVGGSIEEDFPSYYNRLAESIFAKVTFSDDYEAYQDLRYYIRGLALDHPNWRVAVIGAMYEDDVMRVANAIQESGLDVTVLTRYCISSSAFANLDEVMALRSELRRQGLLEDDLDLF